MKTSSLLLAILVLTLSACKKKADNSDHPAGMNPLRTKVNTTAADISGEWEKCLVDELKGKSIYTKVSLSNSMEIRETTYDDSHCQMIESTKERTVISFYYIEIEDNLIRAKIQSRKLNLFDRNEVADFNAGNLCGFNDWKMKRPKEILGISCSTLPRDNKHDLSFFHFSKSGEKLIFAEQEMKKITELKEEVTPSQEFHNTTNSEVYLEPGSSNVMVVSPPKTETLSIEVGQNNTENMNFCDSVLNTYKTSVNSSARITAIKSEADLQNLKLDSLKKDVSKSIEQLMEYVQANNLQDFDALVKESEELEESIASMEVEYKTCSATCDEIWPKLRDLRNQRKVINSKFNNFGINRRVSNGYYVHVSNIERAETTVKKFKESMHAKERQVLEAENKHLKLFDDLATMEGTPGSVKFVSQWPKNLQTLMEANPTYKFKYADISKVVLTYKLKGLGNYPGSSSILGLPLKGSRVLVNGRLGLEAYPISLEGSVKLSLLASCPARNPELYGLKLNTPRVLDYELTFSFAK